LEGVGLRVVDLQVVAEDSLAAAAVAVERSMVGRLLEVEDPAAMEEPGQQLVGAVQERSLGFAAA